MKPRKRKRQLRVSALSRKATKGWLSCGHIRFICALGRSGLLASKREGDGGTPMGSWRLREALYRADQMRRPRTGLPLRPIRPTDGWCDAPRDRNYNRRVRLPYPASSEELWRPDRIYDLVVVLGYNDRPRKRGLGSAIFLHLARDGLTPTAGCIALHRADALRLLSVLRRGDTVRIGV